MKADWREVLLGKVAEIAAGQAAPQGGHCYGEHGYPFVRAGSLDRLTKGMPENSLEHIEEPIAKKHRLRLFPKNTVLLAKSGMSATKGLVYRLKQPCYVVSHLAAVMPSINLDPSFLVYWLLSHSPARLIRDPAYPSVRLSDIGEIRVPLPPVHDQRRIVAILAKADAIRRKRQEGMQLTDKILGSVFFEMFGDLEMNPKGWPIHLLGDHLTFVTSGSRGWAKHYSSSGARFIRSLDVQMNRISDTGAVFVSPPPGAEAKRTRVHPGDVLLTITGSRIGRVAPFSQDIGNAYVSQHVAIIRLDEVLRPRFLSMFLSDRRGGQHQIQQMHYGQTKPGLNLEQIRKFKVPYPPLSLQDRFIAIWEHYDRNLDHLSMACRGSEHLFNSLVQRAFRGEL
jgi:type I restriction enzyme S subunit